MIADIKSNEVKRTQGARRASGVFAGQGDGVNVTSFTTIPEFGSESSIENFQFEAMESEAQESKQEDCDQTRRRPTRL